MPGKVTVNVDGSDDITGWGLDSRRAIGTGGARTHRKETAHSTTGQVTYVLANTVNNVERYNTYPILGTSTWPEIAVSDCVLESSGQAVWCL